MKTLPIKSVDALAVRASNTGIVPPYMLAKQVPMPTGGFIPPYILEQIAQHGTSGHGTITHGTIRNPGIVPPWLQGTPVGPTHPVAGVAALAR